MSGTTLTDFLLNLAEDPRQAEAFKANPRQVLEESGLSEEDQKILLSGDPQAIRAAIDSDKLAGKIVTIIFITGMMD